MREFQSGHPSSGPVRVELEYQQGKPAVMIEQDAFDIVSLAFDDIDEFVAYLLELKEKHTW